MIYASQAKQRLWQAKYAEISSGADYLTQVIFSWCADSLHLYYLYMLILPSDSPDFSLLSGIHGQCFDCGWDREAMAGLFLVNNTLTFVAPGNAGFGIIRIVADEAEIITLAVLPEHRKAGMGRMIADSMLAYTAGKGVKSVFLEVRADNEVAKRLYGSLDFTVLSHRKNYYRDSNGAEADAIVMQKVVV